MNQFDATEAGRIRTLCVTDPGSTYDALMSGDFAALCCDEIIFDPDRIDAFARGYRYNRALDRLDQLGFLVAIEGARALARRMVPFEALQANEARYKAEQDLTDVNLSVLIKGVRYEQREADEGVIYLAIGQHYFREAQRSAATLIRHNPGLQVTVFSDQPKGEVPVAYVSISADRSPFKLKVEAMKRSPYAQTVFLDSDTLVCGSLRFLFETLRSVDFCLCEAPSFHYEDGRFVFDAYHRSGALNTGVIAFGNKTGVSTLLDLWAEAMAPRKDAEIWAGGFADQDCFNEVVIASPEFKAINSQILDNRIWNLRSYALGQAIEDGMINATKIIHAKKWEARRFWSVDLDQFISVG